MSNDNLPAVAQPAPVPVVDEKTLKEYLLGSNTKLTEQQQRLFFGIATRYQLDPFKREVYAIKYGDNFNIITGYEVYLKRAERSGKLAGWSAGTEDEGESLMAWCEIHRKDWSHPLRIDVDLAEYKQNNAMWKSKPKTMLRKVAIAQAFRMAFPDELGGMPYTADEMPVNVQPADVVDMQTGECLPAPDDDCLGANVGGDFQGRKAKAEKPKQQDTAEQAKARENAHAWMIEDCDGDDDRYASRLTDMVGRQVATVYDLTVEELRGIWKTVSKGRMAA